MGSAIFLLAQEIIPKELLGERMSMKGRLMSVREERADGKI